MTLDLSEFHGVFFEECFEGLDVMESGLLNLDQGTDVEAINAIFRAAHSIKGGGASFGFMDISNFTHVMETLLDEMRVGSRTVTRAGVDVLLESVDVLRGMLNAAKEHEEIDDQLIANAKNKLEVMLADQGDHTAASADSDSDSDSDIDSEVANVSANKEAEVPEPESQESATLAPLESDMAGWCIHFTPHAQMVRSGNEPASIFRELKGMGAFSVEVNTSNLPCLEEIKPELCYLGWKLEIRGDISEQDIYELFNWVADECDLKIDAIGPAGVKAADGGNDALSVPAVTPGTDVSTMQKTVVQDTAGPRSTGKKNARETGGSIRVATDKVDELVNMVGELVITQSMLSQITTMLSQNSDVEHDPKILEKLLAGMGQLERNTRELQENVLKIRMLPISFSFSRLPRLVHDLGSQLGKKIELKLTGEQTELDKTVLEKIGDPLVHLVRNSLDHGIEVPEVRLAAGKPETGTLELSAYHKGGDIIIEVTDDGAGLDRDQILGKAIEKGVVGANEALSDQHIYNLIFAPGFSTAEVLSDVSGRGVGLDVVRRNVRDLGGNVSIKSNLGAGTTVTIRLPLTLAILDGQLIQISDETYIVSLVSIVESLQMKPEQISSVTGQSELYYLRNEYIPIIRVNTLFNVDSDQAELQSGLLMVVETDGKRFGLFVDNLLGQQQVVIKSLKTNFQQVQGISGATILGDGTVALIIDVPGLIQRYFENCGNRGKALNAVA